MRLSQYFLTTIKEDPAQADLISHRLMLRAGLIQQLSSGIYTWLPIGLRVLRKVEQIIREEMIRIGAAEIVMPLVQPADIWKKSNRLAEYGPELLRFMDRNQRECVLAPTHEEVITTLIRDKISSYKQLPLILFQLHTKFRDEIRPRFGVMRAREFVMKDAYSFHTNNESLNDTYKKMREAYCNIFTRLELQFAVVTADTGTIGGAISHEFQVLAQNGEDSIAFSNVSQFAANVELIAAPAPALTCLSKEDMAPLQNRDFSTNSLDAFIANYSLMPMQFIKVVVAKIKRSEQITHYYWLLLRADHELNQIKLAKFLAQFSNNELQLLSEQEIQKTFGMKSLFLGPHLLPLDAANLNITVIADHSVMAMTNFSSGANQENQFYCNINWQRDLMQPAHITDIRNVIDGDPSPDGKGALSIKRGIEVGHIFQLGDKYSAKLGATIQDEGGQITPIKMGCYGIGVSRIVAAIIEQYHDKNGIIWPDAVAPFQIAIVPINPHKSALVKQTAQLLYQFCLAQKIEVILDDREKRLGEMLSDLELIGIPHILIIGDRNLVDEKIEYKNRRSNQKKLVSLEEINQFILDELL